MNFIDIFDFSKYFKRSGDGQKAKVGHVNAVIEELGYTEKIVEISSAQILNMGQVPVELLPRIIQDDEIDETIKPDDVVKKYYDIDKIIFEYKYNSVPYSNVTPIQIVNFSLIQIPLFINSDFITVVKSSSFYDGQSVLNGHIDMIDQSISMSFCEGDNPTLGDGKLRARIFYKIRKLYL